MKLAGVAVEGAAFGFDKAYDYIIPAELIPVALPGCRVTVPFGKGSKKKLGFILSVHEGEAGRGFKKISEVLDNAPLLNEEMLTLVTWLKERTFCTLYEAAKAMLPSGINHRMVKSYAAADDAGEKAVLLSGPEQEAFRLVSSRSGYVKRDVIHKALGFAADNTVLDDLVQKGLLYCNTDAVRKVGDAAVRQLMPVAELPEGIKLTAKQKTVYEYLCDAECATVKEVCYFTGVTPAVPAALVKSGAARWIEFEVMRTPGDIVAEEHRNIQLTDEQQKAYEGITAKIRDSRPAVTLLYGVTGSGKTSVYLKAIDDVVLSGKSVIVMVPEIALTPQTLSLFRKRYGKKVAVFHSALSAGERLDEWKRAKSGEATIVIGTRSAVFAPLQNIGLIIIDEEQEHTYKSEQSPRYNAVDVAKFRAVHHNCLLLLASATPSVESFAAAKGGRYGLETIRNRYGSARLPRVITVDMLHEPTAEGCPAVSQKLLDLLRENLENGMQSILLMNRRGYNTFVACKLCGHVISCPNCSISLTYHAANKRLMCHYCGYSVPFTETCPQCSENSVRYAGFGTQKIEDDLARLLPGARILRMDTDTTSGKDSHEKMLRAFAERQYDIMLGTQMVAKGLDFSSVTLVGVVSADQQLYNDDFRSLEKTFDLLTQVVGRSGRGEYEGRAVIQTMTPENEVIRLAARQDYEAFYSTEIQIRKALVYPPFCDICVLAFIGENEGKVKAASNEALRMIKECTQGDYHNEKLMVLGPHAARVVKVSNRYRYRLIIKCRAGRAFREMIAKIITDFGNKKEYGTVTVFADLNPETII